MRKNILKYKCKGFQKRNPKNFKGNCEILHKPEQRREKTMIKLTHKTTKETRDFPSYAEAAKWAGVSREAVRQWAKGIAKSRKYDVLEYELEKPKMPYENDNWRLLPFASRYRSYYVSKEGQIMNDLGVLLTPTQVANGYWRVSLGQNGRYFVHRLVAIAWLGDKTAEGLEVDHIDGNKSNNALSNLQWITHQENCAKAHKNIA